jgi:hypothetical protein
MGPTHEPTGRHGHCRDQDAECVDACRGRTTQARSGYGIYERYIFTPHASFRRFANHCRYLCIDRLSVVDFDPRLLEVLSNHRTSNRTLYVSGPRELRIVIGEELRSVLPLSLRLG